MEIQSPIPRPAEPRAQGSGEGLHVQYGCGASDPEGWLNFDASPTVRIQRLPWIGGLARRAMRTKFPLGVRHGDILRGLPGVSPGSCAGVYCSHILEHLSLRDCRKALARTFEILRPGGVFRLAMPDLERAARRYIGQVDAGNAAASHDFMGWDAMLGVEERRRGLMQMLRRHFGNSEHLWMWDWLSMSEALREAGFVSIRRCECGDCEDPMFARAEHASRFDGCLAIECRRPAERPASPTPPPEGPA